MADDSRARCPRRCFNPRPLVSGRSVTKSLNLSAKSFQSAPARERAILPVALRDPQRFVSIRARS